MRSCTIGSEYPERNHLPLLQWARENGCNWDDETCLYASKYGNLHILQYCVDNGCPFNRDECLELAADSGHTLVVEWIRRFA